MKKEQEQQIIPVQCIPINTTENEIDLKELIKTILNYKKFIFLFVIFFTLLALIYVFFIAKPVYQIKAYIEPGYINSYLKDKIEKNYIINPDALKIEIVNNFDNSKNRIGFPVVKAKKIKDTNIIELQIQDRSNELAKNNLDKIFKYIKDRENNLLSLYIKNIKQQIDILNRSKDDYKKEINGYRNQLKKTTDPQIYQALLNAISKDKEMLLNIDSKLETLKNSISPINIKNTHFAGKITIKDTPIKPKKRLIVIVAFITSLILAIFLVFLIEFIKEFKEN